MTSPPENGARVTWPYHRVGGVPVKTDNGPMWKCKKCAELWPPDVSREVIEQGECAPRPGSLDYAAYAKGRRDERNKTLNNLQKIVGGDKGWESIKEFYEAVLGAVNSDDYQAEPLRDSGCPACQLVDVGIVRACPIHGAAELEAVNAPNSQGPNP